VPDVTAGQPGAVLFDLDGTLVDSFPGIAAAYHHMLVEMDLGDLDDDELRPLIGPPVQAVLEERFGLSGERLNEGVRSFRHHYGSEGLFRFSAYPGIDLLLRQLRDLGFDLRVATSKMRSMAVEIVQHAGWTDLFTVIGGAEPIGGFHRKRDVIEWTLDRAPRGVQGIAMVGDRGVDLVAGRQFGLAGIGVTWGYGSTRELVEAGAIETADSAAELFTALTRLAPLKGAGASGASR
jgi:phosphoglycolate phosphatase